MKKIFISIILCSVLIIAILSSCGNNNNSSVISLESSEVKIDSTDYNNLKLLTGNAIQSRGTSNSKGFYSLFYNNDSSSNILYIDYETQSQIYLCSNPNCNHDDDTCTAFLSAENTNVKLIASEENLFVIFHNNPGVKIEMRNLNGNNSKIVYETQNEYFLNMQSFQLATNENKIIFSATKLSNKTSNNNSPLFEDVIVEVDIKSGQSREIFSASDILDLSKIEGAALTFEGVTDGKLIIESMVQHPYDVPENNPEQGFINKDNALETFLYVINPSNNEIVEILNYKSLEISGVCFNDLYFMSKTNDDGTVDILSYNFITEETQTLLKDVKNNVGADKIEDFSASDIIILGIYNNNLVLNVLKDYFISLKGDIEVVWQGIALNIDTKTYNELKLTNYYHASTMPDEVLASFGTQLLVFSDAFDGFNEITNSYYVDRQVGIISIDDYLNSIDNYSYVNMLRDYP